MSDELTGKFNKLDGDLKAIKGEVYNTTMSCVTMIETAEAHLEKGDTKELQMYLNQIRRRLMYLKGFTG